VTCSIICSKLYCFSSYFAENTLFSPMLTYFLDLNAYLGSSDLLSHTKGISSHLLGFDARHCDAVHSCWTTRRHIPKSVFLFLLQTPSLTHVLFLSSVVLNVSLILAVTAVAIYTRSRPAHGSTPGREKSLLSSLKTPDRLCVSHSLLFSGYGGYFPRGKSSRGVKLTTYVFSVLRLVVEIFLIFMEPCIVV